VLEEGIDGGGERGGVDGIEGEAAAVEGDFAEGAAGGADAGFAEREAFDDGKAEALGDGRIDGEGAVGVGARDGFVGRGAVVAERAAGGLEGAQAGEGGGAGGVGVADEAELERGAAGPEGFGGVEEGEVVFATLEGADGEDDGRCAGGRVVYEVTLCGDGIDAEGKGEDGGRVGDAEPSPVGEEGIAGVGGDGSDAVELEEFAEVSGKNGRRWRAG